MLAIAQSHYTMAKEGCYRCGVTHDLVDMDAHIEGEGALVICRGCIREACYTLGIDLKSLEAKAVATDAYKEELELAQADYRKVAKDLREARKALKEATA